MKLIFLGDIFPANLPYNRGFGVAAAFHNSSNKEEYTDKLKDIFDDSDIVFGNLEAPILPNDQFSVHCQFAGEIVYLKMLKNSGVNFVTIANNHILEHGCEGFNSTIDILKNLGFRVVGAREKNNSSHIEVTEKDGLKLGFVAYNAIDTKFNKLKLYSEYQKQNILSDIERMNLMGLDYKFVALHWGDEYVHRPSLKQIQDAHDFIDAGADFIIGSHPHVIQPVEKYKNGLICYSLGNFIFDMNHNMPVRFGCVVECTLHEKHYDYVCQYIEIGKDYLPRLCSLPPKIERKLSEANKMMAAAVDHAALYEQTYIKDARYARLWNRLISKKNLLKNWFKYSPDVRNEFLHLYKSKLFKK